jgi:hypothetical protein
VIWVTLGLVFQITSIVLLSTVIWLRGKTIRMVWDENYLLKSELELTSRDLANWRVIGKHAGEERDKVVKLLDHIMLLSESQEVNECARKSIDILRGEQRLARWAN